MFPLRDHITSSAKYTPEQKSVLLEIVKIYEAWLKVAMGSLGLDDDPVPETCQERRAVVLASMLFPNLEAEDRELLARLIFLGVTIFMMADALDPDGLRALLLDKEPLKIPQNDENIRTMAEGINKLKKIAAGFDWNFDKKDLDAKLRGMEAEFTQLKQQFQSERSEGFDSWNHLTPIQEILLNDFLLRPLREFE